jgi:ankyrin repeat protein
MKRASSTLTGTTPDAYPAPIHAAGAPLAAHAPMVYSVPVAPAAIAPPAFYVAARSGDAATVRAMLAWGRFRASAAEPRTGRTALMLSAERGHANVVAMLTRGTLAAYIDVEDAEGNTALSLATASNREAVVAQLRARGAGYSGQDAGPVPNHTDTHTAILSLVLRYTPPSRVASAASAPQPGQRPKQHKLAAIFSAIDHNDANGAETDDCTPLMVAAKNGHASTVQALVMARVNIDKAGRKGWTALMLAAYYGHLGAVRELLDARANVHRTTDDGVPALTYAAMNGHADIVRALLRAGASSDCVSTNGHTALSLATARQHAEVIELLRVDGAMLFRDWRI